MALGLGAFGRIPTPCLTMIGLTFSFGKAYLDPFGEHARHFEELRRSKYIQARFGEIRDVLFDVFWCARLLFRKKYLRILSDYTWLKAAMVNTRLSIVDPSSPDAIEDDVLFTLSLTMGRLSFRWVRISSSSFSNADVVVPHTK
ncbi:unnamed protein product [Cuscuta campestris]|uniref:Uncharacterized protein n=1 Tax=Cuscuta campestris TaxID=132261 RepID=A0A484MDL9_9ASTE|nr:unnamed protein product [Cuscuta campestris]